MDGKALFLDRDGIINQERGTFTWRKKDFVLVQGILELGQYAQQKGYQLAVITNQSGIARGLYDHGDVDTLHAYMAELFAEAGINIAEIYYCPHHPVFSGKCFCRKPGSLMIERAAAKLRADPNRSFMLGDKERDLIAGKRVGCMAVGVGESPISIADINIRFPDELIPYL